MKVLKGCTRKFEVVDTMINLYVTRIKHLSANVADEHLLAWCHVMTMFRMS